MTDNSAAKRTSLADRIRANVAAYRANGISTGNDTAPSNPPSTLKIPVEAYFQFLCEF
jgi:hypothetical protein